jgi:hypothetical protein
MTLQSSGPISLLDVQNEFGGSNPIGINEYYGRAAGIPSSGTISLADFYGKSASIAFSGWNYLMFGSSYTTSSSTSSNTYTGILVTGVPGSRYLRVDQEGETSVGPFTTLTVQYYQGGSLNTTWTYTTYQNSSIYGQTSFFTATPGGSSMQFVSTISDPNQYDDLGMGSNRVSDTNSPYTTLFGHQFNYTGLGNYYDD